MTQKYAKQLYSIKITFIITATGDQTELQTRRDTTGSFELIFLDKDGSSAELDLPYNEFLFLASNLPILVTQVTLLSF